MVRAFFKEMFIYILKTVGPVEPHMCFSILYTEK